MLRSLVRPLSYPGRCDGRTGLRISGEQTNTALREYDLRYADPSDRVRTVVTLFVWNADGDG